MNCVNTIFILKQTIKDLNAFCEKKINKLSCVNALNEGMNIPDVDCSNCTVKFSELNTVQRIGRCIRYRPGHEAIIYILSVLQTQDEKWLQKLLILFDKDNIEY